MDFCTFMENLSSQNRSATFALKFSEPSSIEHHFEQILMNLAIFHICIVMEAYEVDWRIICSVVSVQMMYSATKYAKCYQKIIENSTSILHRWDRWNFSYFPHQLLEIFHSYKCKFCEMFTIVIEVWRIDYCWKFWKLSTFTSVNMSVLTVGQWQLG